VISPPAEPTPRSLRVLIADDHQDSATSLVDLIKMWGHEAHAVFDGRAALRSIDIYHPDVLILDILMPNLDGFQLAEALREEQMADRTALIAHSAYFDDDYRRKAIEVGIDHYLLKPVEPMYLKSLLAGIAEAGALVPRPI
jgi:CheY-like chemotaxis protein